MKKYKMLAGGVVLSCVITGVFFLGGYFGHGYGVQQCVRAVSHAITAADYPTLAIAYPTGQVMAEYRDGVCIPFPRHVPTLYHHFYVSPQYMPCASQHYTNPTAVSPALAAIESHVN